MPSGTLLVRPSDGGFSASGAHGPKRPLRAGSRNHHQPNSHQRISKRSRGLDMKIDEKSRETIQAELERANRGLWLKLVSEVHYNGDEVYFWFLIDARNNLPDVYKAVSKTLSAYLESYVETKFNVSFNQKEEGHSILWDSISDEELRSGVLRRKLGNDPISRPLRDRDIFGPNT